MSDNKITTESAVRQRLQEIRERVKSGTKKPWSAPSDHELHIDGDVGEGVGTLMLYASSDGCDDMVSLEPEDFSFIAGASRDVPALLDLIEALLHEIEVEQSVSESDLLVQTHDALARFGEGR